MEDKIKEKKEQLEKAHGQQLEALRDLETRLSNANRNLIALEGAIQALNELMEADA